MLLFRQLFLLKPFPLLPPPSPSAWNAHFSWQGPDSLPMNLCSKREEKKCKKQMLPAGQPRGAAKGPGSETALAGFLPESTGALGCCRGVGRGRDPQNVRMGWHRAGGWGELWPPSSEPSESPCFSWVLMSVHMWVWGQELWMPRQ